MAKTSKVRQRNNILNIIYFFLFNIALISALTYSTNLQISSIYKDVYRAEITGFLNVVKKQSTDIIQKEKLSKKEKQEELIRYLASISHKGFYFWANDNKGVAVYHIDPSKIGSFQSSYIRHISKSERGVIFEMTDNINPSTGQRQDKINGYFILKPWGWVIGHGRYIDSSGIELKAFLFAMKIGIPLILFQLIIIFFYRRRTY
ncbi:cache domain-containing protein [Vibrio salinus]|uniref:cache domain-containing protein n=1 Tax=Vibrio salinus TaxID=2899784 RepID=UPI001E5AEFEC|nr:cache domain-containing protein [Vibrio salinus]MCE0494788.1 cache domain-containing protein [Vibrio salinus]